MTTIRQQRIANLLFEELSILIANELADPRLHLVSVTNVVVSRDLRNVKVFVHHQDEQSTEKDVLQALKNATAYMRAQIAQRAGLRITPELLFYYDDTPAKAARIDELLSQIASERDENSKNQNSPGEVHD